MGGKWLNIHHTVVSSHLKGGVKVAGVAHIKHPRAWPSWAPVTQLHLVTAEVCHPGLGDLVQLPGGRGLGVRGGARVPVTVADDCRQDHVL